MFDLTPMGKHQKRAPVWPVVADVVLPLGLVLVLKHFT